MSLGNTHAIVNFFLYTSRHHELRAGIVYLIRGKMLTQNALKLLEQQQQAQQNGSRIGSNKVTPLYATAHNNGSQKK